MLKTLHKNIRTFLRKFECLGSANDIIALYNFPPWIKNTFYHSLFRTVVVQEEFASEIFPRTQKITFLRHENVLQGSEKVLEKRGKFNFVVEDLVN